MRKRNGRIKGKEKRCDNGIKRGKNRDGKEIGEKE